MKIRISRSHINADGAVRAGAILDLSDAQAVDLVNAKLAVLHTEESTVPAVRKPPEQATKPRKSKETR